MRLACQYVWIGIWVFGFFASIYGAINGSEARKPSGFTGVLVIFAVYAFSIALNYEAGVFEGFFR